MISVNNYNLKYNTEHLLTPKPKTYSEIFDRLNTLECKLFYNIISSPECNYEKGISENRIKEHYKKLNAEDRFKNIFTEQKLYANPKGFFINKLKKPSINCNKIKSVSFTLSDYEDLPKHFKARKSDYGICFFHDFLQNKGIRPVEYLNENEPIEKKELVFNSPHLIEIYSKRYDMRWENEWRISDDINFTQKDIAFVIVPQDRFNYLVEWFMDMDEFEDIAIISSNTYKSYIDHLIFYPQQDDNSWNQVKIWAGSGERGFPISPEDFNSLDINRKKKFEATFKDELDCLAKNTILINYEFRYINRFMKFRNQIKEVDKLGVLFQDYNSIKENSEEPIEAQRDLILGLFGDLYTQNPIY